LGELITIKQKDAMDIAVQQYTGDDSSLAGFYRMTNKQYHAAPGISTSFLQRLDQSPLHAMTPPEPTPAFDFGSAFHSLVLEPDTFTKFNHVLNESPRTNAGKAERAGAEKLGKIVVKPDDYNLMLKMAKAIHDTKTAKRLLDPDKGAAEISGFWSDDQLTADGYKILCKLRADFIHQSRIVIDVKSAADASPGAFCRAIVNFKYHWQAFLYLRGMTVLTGTFYDDFVWIVVEKAPPHAVGIYMATQEMLELAQEGIYRKRLFLTYRECMESGAWPGYQDAVLPLELPGWAKRAHNPIIE